MNNIKIIFSVVLSLFLGIAYAQEADIDTAKNPVRQTDPTVHQTPEQMKETAHRDMIKISPSEIPTSMENALKGSDYKGGSKTFYRSKSGDSYLVEIQDGNITHTYRFDKQGQPVNSKKN